MKTMSNVSRLVLEVDSSGVIKATGNLNEFARASKAAEQSAGHFDDIFSRMNLSSLAAVAGVTALVGALNKIGSSLMGAVNTYAGFEKIEVGLSGVMKNLGETKRASDDFLKSLKTLSNETTFGYNTLADAASQMLTVGVSSDEVKKRLIQLGNAAGGSTEKFNRLSQVYTNILATGKAGAMQLQQLSTITGTSFVNALGKTNASAEEVTAQIEKLTSAGGMLEGAMDSLIDTVEGKQGFVSDWFDEMTRNFAEASGLVDVYKGIMDILSSVLETLAGWFAKISESPLGKAILSGVLAAALGMIVTTIGVGLVNAVIRLNAQLAITATLKAIINPAMAAVGLGIAAVVGTTIGLSSAMDKAKRSAEDLKEALDKFDSSPVGIAKGQVSAYDNQIKANIEVIKNLKQQQEDAFNNAYIDAAASGNFDEVYKQKVEQIKNSPLSQYIALLEEENAEYERRKKLLEDNISLSAQFDRNKNELDKIITGQMSSNEKSLKDIQETLEKLNNIKAVSDKALSTGLIKQSEYDTVTQKLDDALDKSLKKEREIKIKIANENLTDWQKFLKEAYGLTNEEVYKMPKVNESNALSVYNAKNDKQNSKLNKFREAGLINTDNLTLAEQKLERINKLVEEYYKSEQNLVDDNSIKLLQNLQAQAIADVFNAQIEAYDKELANFNKSAEDLRREELGKKFTPEQTEQIIDKENEIKKRQDLVGYMSGWLGDRSQSDAVHGSAELESAKQGFVDAFNAVKELDLAGTFSSLGSAFSDVGSVVIDTLQGIALSFASSVVSASGDLQAFAQEFQSGGIIGGIIAVVVEALTNVCKGMDGFDEAMNPVTTLFENLSEVIYFLMTIISTVVKVIKSVAKIINTFLKIFSPITKLVERLISAVGNFVEWLADGFESLVSKIFWWIDIGDEKAEQEEDEIARLQKLKDEYSALYDAMKEQEEYYINKKNEINAEQYKLSATPVHDMILTDKGVFSTDPKDTIMAMKRPGDLLGGGGSRIYVTINNNAGVEVTTEERTTDGGDSELIVNISRAVAADFASGANGWDSAYESQQSRVGGRRISI